MRWTGILALILLVLVVGAEFLAPKDPLKTHPDDSLSAPSLSFPLGTDLLGRDVLSRVLYGGRRTLIVAAVASGLAILGGHVLGLIAGYSDSGLVIILELIITSLLAIPSLILALAFITWLGPGSMQIALAVGLSQLPFVAQVVQTAVKQAKQAVFVESSLAMGAKSGWVMRWHIVPSILPTSLSYGVATFSYTIIQSVGLSFLGLSGDLSVPDWGVMLAEGRNTLQEAPWISLAPGIMLVMSVVLLNRFASRLSIVKGMA